MQAATGHPKDKVLRYDDVELPEGRLADKLRDEQYEHFSMDAAAVGAGAVESVAGPR